MAVFKRNIWTLFWLLLLGGIVLLVVLLHYRWQSIQNYHQSYHKSRTELVAQAVDSVLRTQELVLDVIGRELLNHEEVFETSRRLPLLDNILAVNTTLAGFGLARPDGTLVRISSNLDPDKLPNLRAHPSTGASFEQALNSDVMVLGRTYFVTAMGEWLIPIRKALRDDNGKVIAVMTAGIRISSEGSVFARTHHDGPDDSVTLYRESDSYVQFMSRQNTGPDIFSQLRNTPEQRQGQRQWFEANRGMTEAEIKASPDAVILMPERKGESYLAAVHFNPRYQIWVVSETSQRPVRQEFLYSALLYLLVFAALGGIAFALFRVIDRAERKRQHELLYHSTHDDLTRLLNRAGLLNWLTDNIRQHRPFSLVIINIDNFKGINDRFGQDIGDCTLIEFSRRLHTLLDEEDLLARLGGDEFVITTPNTRLPALNNACQMLLDQMARSFTVGRLQLQLTTSIGIATFPEHGDSPSRLIRSAHLALYQAKHCHNSLSIYQDEMEQAYLRHLSVEQRLRQALQDQALHVVFQPQFDDCKLIVGMEALVRWQDDELGTVSPTEFVTVAEQSGLMLALGRFVLDSSIRQYSELRTRHGRRLDLAINISVIQFEQPDFVRTVLEVLQAYQVSPRELVLEITESLIINNVDQVLCTIEQLHAEGIRLSIDDFGTGYSSLGMLRKLPIDELKIDKSFVDSVLDDPRATKMIQNIIYIASTHDMDVVVEGVETEAQANALIEMGCRRFQGYYFSRPIPVEQLHRLLCTESDSRNPADDVSTPHLTAVDS